MDELSGKYDGAEDFTNTRVKELCLKHGILEQEVRFYVFFMLRIQFSTNAAKNESFFALK